MGEVSLTSVRADRLYNNYNLTETLTRNEEIKGLGGGGGGSPGYLL